ncbi:hypothetical protein C4D60_Mb05t15110 [Musa balbisiana]|uniref:Uncharacterized protein n=1 Tax=Musa balbisiana TaxID=52838 RepID=A0A4S8JWA2_MUSBA|nr:hypothetical protein C4D60_Mb05t15110 [Musa balbisiana]
MAMDDVGSSSNNDIRHDRRSWFGNWGKRIGNHKQGKKKVVPQRSSLCMEEEVGNYLVDSIGMEE